MERLSRFMRESSSSGRSKSVEYDALRTSAKPPERRAPSLPPKGQMVQGGAPLERFSSSPPPEDLIITHKPEVPMVNDQKYYTN